MWENLFSAEYTLVDIYCRNDADPAGRVSFQFRDENAQGQLVGFPFLAGDVLAPAGSFAVDNGPSYFVVLTGSCDLKLCDCDVLVDGILNVFDLLEYLDLWFAVDPAAEFGGDPGTIDVFDLLAFLDCWFPACVEQCL